MSFLGLELRLDSAVLGLIIGMVYGILAVGLMLVYRASKIINFAHTQIGTFGAALLALAVARWSFPYWLAFPLCCAAAAGMGGLVELMVVRRLRNAPKLMSMVATLGVAQFVLLLSVAVASEIRSGSSFPKPSGIPSFEVGALVVTPSYTAMLALTPLLVGGLALFFRYSPYGIAIRASASNADVARLSGIPPGRMSSLAWMIAGAISAYTAILLLPVEGVRAGTSLGLGLLLRALAAALAGRMINLPVGLAAGVGIGLLESLIGQQATGGLTDVILLALIIVVLLFQTRGESREEEKVSWLTVQPWKPLPDALLRVWSIRNLGWIVASLGLFIAVLIPLFSTNETAIVIVSIMAFSLIGFSVALISGMAGQLSLGQFAIAAIGATVSYRVSSFTGNYLLGFLSAGIGAAAASMLIGLPALRVRGLMLAVTTLAFAVTAHSWLLQRDWMLGSGAPTGQPAFAGFVFDTGKEYYVFTLAFLILGLLLFRNLRTGGFGRSLHALRDNEDAARAFTVPVTLRKLQAFALAGFLAGLGGAVFAHGLAQISYLTFPPEFSFSLVAMTVIGGIGVLPGALIGALYIVGIPSFVELDAAGLAASAFGWLVLILYYPAGLAGLFRPLRDRLVDALARSARVDPKAARASGSDEAQPIESFTLEQSEPPEARPKAGGVLLEVKDLHKRYGGVVAVGGVSLKVTEGETLGIIGPNGAGKTTLFELISGFARADLGKVLFEGADVSRLRPEQRGRLGLIRSFQDASLFPTLTVLETVKLALEKIRPAPMLIELLGGRRTEKAKDGRARELIHLMGLDAFRDKQVAELSTGTRRITELAALIASGPKLLLLDEPSSGIAQRETEALVDVLGRVKSFLGTTLVVIEHDMPLISALSDRMLAMESGRVIAEGKPSEVEKDPLVVKSYLGEDVRAIRRSDLAVRGS